MALVAKFTFNPFQENTYVVYDQSGECVLFDPGCYTAAEKEELRNFLATNGLRPVRLINTHCHIDHVFGNRFVADEYKLELEIHRDELPVLEAVPQVAAFYGLPKPEPSPKPTRFLEAGTTMTFGETTMDILLTPGHSPASLSFFCKEDKFVIAGDVLFRNSIGRTDLPGGDYNTLIHSIRTKLFPLGDEVRVFSGHGEDTTIGYERRHNPFFEGRITSSPSSKKKTTSKRVLGIDVKLMLTGNESHPLHLRDHRFEWPVIHLRHHRSSKHTAGDAFHRHGFSYADLAP